jgi:hypothetical protein
MYRATVLWSCTSFLKSSTPLWKNHR